MKKSLYDKLCDIADSEITNGNGVRTKMLRKKLIKEYGGVAEVHAAVVKLCNGKASCPPLPRWLWQAIVYEEMDL